MRISDPAPAASAWSKSLSRGFAASGWLGFVLRCLLGWGPGASLVKISRGLRRGPRRSGSGGTPGEVQARGVGVHVQRERPLVRALEPVLHRGLAAPVVGQPHQCQAVVGTGRCGAKSEMVVAFQVRSPALLQVDHKDQDLQVDSQGPGQKTG